MRRRLADGRATAVLYGLPPVGEDLRGAFQEQHDWAARNDISRLCAPDAGPPAAFTTARGR